MDTLNKIREVAEEAVSTPFDSKAEYKRLCVETYASNEEISDILKELEDEDKGYKAAMQKILKMINNDPHFQMIAEIEKKGYIYDPERGCEYCHTLPNHSVRCRGCMCGNHE